MRASHMSSWMQMRFLAATVSLQACSAGDPEEVSSCVPEAGLGRDFQLRIAQVCARRTQGRAGSVPSPCEVQGQLNAKP